MRSVEAAVRGRRFSARANAAANGIANVEFREAVLRQFETYSAGLLPGCLSCLFARIVVYRSAATMAENNVLRPRTAAAGGICYT